MITIILMLTICHSKFKILTITRLVYSSFHSFITFSFILYFFFLSFSLSFFLSFCLSIFLSFCLSLLLSTFFAFSFCFCLFIKVDFCCGSWWHQLTGEMRFHQNKKKVKKINGRKEENWKVRKNIGKKDAMRKKGKRNAKWIWLLQEALVAWR